MSVENKKRILTLQDVRDKESPLNEWGVNVYVLEGWQLFCYLLAEIDELMDTDQHIFEVACLAGIYRSNRLKKFLEKMLVRVAERKHSSNRETTHGIAQLQLLLQIAGGEVRNGFVLPSGYLTAFNKLVLFMHRTNLRGSDIQLRLHNTFLALQEFSEVDLENFSIFMVSEDEVELQQLIEASTAALFRDHGSVAAERISEQFNVNHEYVTFRPRK